MKQFLIIFFCSVIAVTVSAQNTLDKVGLTSSTPAAVAYSLRLLSSSYTGPLIRIIISGNSYDVWPDANAAFSFNSVISAANPGTIPGTKNGSTALSTVIGSNSASVSIWYDQSGHATNLTQANGTYQPVIIISGTIQTENNRPFIRFFGISGNGGTKNSLDLPATISTTGQVVMVNKFISPDGFVLGAANTYNWHSDAFESNFLFNLSLASSSIINGSVWQNGVSVAVSSAIWNTTLMVNDIAPSTPGSGTGWDNIGSDRIYHNTTSGGGYAELVVFSAALSTSDRQTIEHSQISYYATLINIVVQPSSTTQSLNAGASATALSVTASGTGLTYQWYSNSSNSNSGGSLISGATSSTYTPSTATGGTLYYYVVVTGNGSITSNVSGAVIIKPASTISNFSNITKTSFDVPFNIVAPTSNSTGAFTYSSSNTSVATISGTTVTIVGAGTTTITATEASDATYSTASITATLTVNSATVITKNGQITSTGTNYVNKNGATSSSTGVNKNGQIITARSSGDGLSSSTASTSAYAIKQAYPSSADGYYWIANANINGGAAFQIYADMTTNGGGWTLILQNAYSSNSWTYTNSVLFNQTSPSYISSNSNNNLGVSYDYSIISWADYIKKSSSGFQYMIDSYQRGQYGGIFTANSAYSFVSTTNGNTNITNNQWFSGLGYNDNNGIGPRMPWWVNTEGFITTSDTGTGTWWGSLVTGENNWNPSPLLSNHNPSYIIWYWVR